MPARIAETGETNVVDLMSAFRASLGARGNAPAVGPKSKTKATRTAAAKPRSREAG
jgi:non-homologous end joining protein Ku